MITLSKLDNYLPRLLLVSEVSLSQEGTGINRTLVNLLEDYPIDHFMLYTSDQSLQEQQTAPRFQKNVTNFPARFFPYLQNRLGAWLNPILEKCNYQLLDWLSLANSQQIADFSPEVILICPNTPLGLLMGYKVTQDFDVPFLIYFMDDWVAQDNTSWVTGNVQLACSSILKKAAGWLMISQQLEKDLAQRYNVSPKRSLIVHNPVDLSNKTFPNFPSETGKTFKVVYAGSIWPMHHDAIAVIAQAIYELRHDGIDIELVLHTGLNYWQAYKENWEAWEVNYGSLIPYQELNQYLQRANLLLVASSFLPEYAHVTRSSVQTKITDYMAAGRPIISCGPSYAANNIFIKQWNCGFVCETNTIPEVKQILLTQMIRKSLGETVAKIAFDVLKNHFDKSKVNSKLYQFIANTRVANVNTILGFSNKRW
ncbi:MAG: glycosyltransferase [Goleter apudmare HA4340-LM2]|jgi:glycosyltransferase involved in cell wall biosynthesis|nr:glycosyltransferase [Goleter apudmare HA4340-LM2]